MHQPGPGEAQGSQDVEVLRRWEDLGATWRVLARRPDQLLISLCRCDAGEEVDRLASADPDLLAYVGNRGSSEDPPASTG